MDSWMGPSRFGTEECSDRTALAQVVVVAAAAAAAAANPLATPEVGNMAVLTAFLLQIRVGAEKVFIALLTSNILVWWPEMMHTGTGTSAAARDEAGEREKGRVVAEK